LLQCTAFTGRSATIPHQSDGVNLNKQSDGAALISGLGIKNMSFPERQVERLWPRWILAKQESKVGRWFVSCCDRYYHEEKTIRPDGFYTNECCSPFEQSFILD
jgi:hypothetical protein